MQKDEALLSYDDNLLIGCLPSLDQRAADGTRKQTLFRPTEQMTPVGLCQNRVRVRPSQLQRVLVRKMRRLQNGHRQHIAPGLHVAKHLQALRPYPLKYGRFPSSSRTSGKDDESPCSWVSRSPAV